MLQQWVQIKTLVATSNGLDLAFDPFIATTYHILKRPTNNRFMFPRQQSASNQPCYNACYYDVRHYNADASPNPKENEHTP